MKNKIILLTLVLLIPSLCFGESVIFGVVHNPKEGILAYSIESTSYGRKVIEFKIHNQSMFLSDNIDQMKELGSLSQTLFPNLPRGLILGGVLKKDTKKVNIALLMNCVASFAVADNYAITAYRKVNENFEIFYLYKQDK